jgi:chemotaxis protein MotB
MPGSPHHAPSEAESRDDRLRRRRRHAALISHERWVVSYADFMTLLFALFVVLFAASVHGKADLGRLAGAVHQGFGGKATASISAGRQVGDPTGPVPAAAADSTSRSVPGQPDPTLRQVRTELYGLLGQAIEHHEVSLTETPDGLVLSFQELGFFHSGEANLVPGQAAKMVAAGEILKRHNLVVRVEGHSDDQPIHNAIFASNWELSAARAMTVLLLLVDQTHYDPTRLSMAGYGPYRPVASNATFDGRQKNRRVDLVILRNQVVPR